MNDIKIHKDVNIITTQKHITEYVVKQNFKNTIEITGASFLQKGHTYTLRNINNKTLKVCYSALGKPTTKGGNVFLDAAKLYKTKYPKDDVKFITIGNCQQKENIEYFPAMAMENLKVLYDGIDVIVSPVKNYKYNGWPIGVEAILRGCVLITTDEFNLAQYYPFGNDILTVDIGDVVGIVNHIKILYDDRKLLCEISNMLQKKASQFYSFENQQQKIFDYIEVINANKHA